MFIPSSCSSLTLFSHLLPAVLHDFVDVRRSFFGATEAVTLHHHGYHLVVQVVFKWHLPLSKHLPH